MGHGGTPGAVSGGRGWPLVVRRATPDDELQVMAFASHTWDGWDYLPRAWPRWIDAADGVLLVGAVGGDGATGTDGRPLARDSVVAVVRVAVPAPGEGWLEGIRVAPRVRGMGVATDLQVAELHWAAANGARIVRYATGARNEGSMRLGRRGGFELIARFGGLSWDPPEAQDDESDDESGFHPHVQAQATLGRRAVLAALEDEGLIGRAALGDGKGTWGLIINDASFNAGARLYEPRPWALEELTEAKFQRHLSAGEVIFRRTSDRNEALAILVADLAPAEDAQLRLAMLAGEPRAAFELVEHVREMAGSGIRFRFAEDGPLVAGVAHLYREAGYAFGEWPLHVMARSLDAANPLPRTDPAAVILADRPSALITPAR